MVVLLCGALFVVSADNSDGTDLRPGRYTDLSSLVSSEADRVEGLRNQAAALDAQVDQLTEAASGDAVERWRARGEQLAGPAGLEPVSGAGRHGRAHRRPGEMLEHAGRDTDEVKPLIVHQQDIQAVVNAMWAGGAEAVTLQGQRIVSTTGIKCEGTSVQIQGLPYPQPFVVEAVGSQARLLEAIDEDAYLRGYRAASQGPAIQVGWEPRPRRA